MTNATKPPITMTQQRSRPTRWPALYAASPLDCATVMAVPHVTVVPPAILALEVQDLTSAAPPAHLPVPGAIPGGRQTVRVATGGGHGVRVSKPRPGDRRTEPARLGADSF